MILNQFENKKCYLCDSQKLSIKPGSVRDNKELSVLKCESCSLVFLSSFDHINFIHYQESGMHGCEKPNIKKWLSETQADDKRRFNFLKKKIANKSLLDFGCGVGGFLDLIKSNNKSSFIAGVEPENALQENFKERQLTVFPSIEDPSLSYGWDIITAFHVIEHLKDPIKTINQLANLLNKGGEIIIEVPNSDDVLLSLYENDSFSNFTYWSQHLFLFNNKTFSDLIDKTRLKLNWIKNIQRYPLSNHLYWLSKGLPGGQEIWGFLDEKIINKAYEAQLAKIGKTDTLLASIVI